MMEDLPLPRTKGYGVRSSGHEWAGVVMKVGSDVKGWPSETEQALNPRGILAWPASYVGATSNVIARMQSPRD